MCAVCVLLGVVLGVQCDLSTCIGCVSHLFVQIFVVDPFISSG